MTGKPLHIAVVGAGVAGIVAAWILQRQHHVTLFEKRNRLGGHTNTIIIPDGPDAGTAVDTGFIVCNDKTYPNFHRFLRQLEVPVRWSDMSFGFWDQESGLQYAGTSLGGLFAQPANAANPAFLRMLWEIRRFSTEVLRDLEQSPARLAGVTLGQYLRAGRYSKYMVHNYIVPMGAAIWSTAPGKMLRFPALAFARFFRNHGLLSLKDRPRWQTVVGGSHAYIKAFEKRFTGNTILGARLRSVHREPGGVVLREDGGAERHFDRVVFAVHADQVLPLLADASEDERRLFGPWRYERNHTVLHTDASVLPPNRRAWASWNYTRERGTRPGKGPMSATYHMNRLQGLRTRRQYCVTLNRHESVPEQHVIRELVYTHPLYTRQSIETQEPLRRLSGTGCTGYCGSYLGYGFHEDAVLTAVHLTRR